MSRFTAPIRRGPGRPARSTGMSSGHGERSRSQLHFQLGGAENLSILVVNALAVNVLAVNSVLRVLLTLSSGFVHF